MSVGSWKLFSDRDFRRTVDCDLIHRTALHEVFLTALTPLQDGSFAAAAQLPRSHAYYGDSTRSTRLFDPLLLLEVSRQACIAFGHSYFDVPGTAKFILTHFGLQIDDLAATVIGSTPGRLAISADAATIRLYEEKVSSIDFEVTLTEQNAGRIGTAKIGLAFRSAEAYRALRRKGRGNDTLPSSADHLPTGEVTAPATVGRFLPDNVVIANPAMVDDALSTELVLPSTNASMFDHPQDHVPGMVLLEAARQAATLLAAHHGTPADAGAVTALHSTFGRFAELDQPTKLTAAVNTPEELTVSMTQSGTSVCETTLTVSALSAAGVQDEAA